MECVEEVLVPEIHHSRGVKEKIATSHSRTKLSKVIHSPLENIVIANA